MLLEEAKVDSSEVYEVLKANPKQFISQEIIVPVWAIKYSYTTQRNNLKEAIKYIFLGENDWDLIDNVFFSYIEDFNNRYPYKKISNVKILDAEYIGKMFLPIEN